jgi:hypothetical protein
MPKKAAAGEIQAGYLGKYRGHDTHWQWHEVVVKDGRVYDAFTGSESGIAFDQYKSLWKDRAYIDFGF